jgi:DNA-binding beta-propeller fold protein YncE
MNTFELYPNDRIGGLAFDAANNRLFVSDSMDERVLVFNTSTITNGMSASYVLGQPSTTTCNGSATTQNGLGFPTGLAYDAANSRLFVYDAGVSRVLIYNVAPGTIASGENASYVLGQGSFTTSATGTTQNTLNPGVGGAPNQSNGDGLAYDAADNWLFAADSGNSRVLVFNVSPSSIANGENASYVLGQTNFTSGSANEGGSASQSSLSTPYQISYDPNTARLFVGDDGNDRILVFNVGPGVISNGMKASYELGVSAGTNAFTTAGNGSITQSGFAYMFFVYYDPAICHLFISDSINNRIMIFEGSYIGNFFIPGYD